MFSSKKSDVFVFRKRFSTILMLEYIGSVEPGDRGTPPFACMWVFAFMPPFVYPHLEHLQTPLNDEVGAQGYGSGND